MSSFDNVTVAAGLIKQVVSQIENLEEQKAQILADIRDAYAEAKAQGLDIATLRQLIRLRKRKKEEVKEQEELLEIYRRALEQ